MTHDERPILVFGGTGKTGRRVAARLTGLGLPVRIGSRSATPAFDWEDRTTWRPALHGIRAAYVAYVPDLAFPGAPETIGALAELAAAEGVERLVLLSGRGEPEAQRSERMLAAAGTGWTVVRASFFMQNFSEHFLLDPVLAGEIAFPAGATAEPFVDVDDVADVAVAALTTDGHDGRVYEVTGPRLLTFAEAAAELSTATGRRIDYVPLTGEQYTAGLISSGVPAEEAHALTDLFTGVLDGRNSHLAGGVRTALGREPRDFADYAKRTAATGVWDVTTGDRP